MWSVFVNDDGHKRGQASSPDVGAENRHTVTLKRTYLIVAIFWVFSSFSGLLYFLNYRITLWLGRIGISLYLLT